MTAILEISHHHNYSYYPCFTNEGIKGQRTTSPRAKNQQHVAELECRPRSNGLQTVLHLTTVRFLQWDSGATEKALGSAPNTASDSRCDIG